MAVVLHTTPMLHSSLYDDWTRHFFALGPSTTIVYNGVVIRSIYTRHTRDKLNGCCTAHDTYVVLVFIQQLPHGTSILHSV